MKLSLIEKRILDQLKEHLSVIAAGHPVAKIGESYEETELCFQAIACCKILGSVDKASFQRYLFWSGLTRRYFLHRSQGEGSSGNFRCARSRSEGFFCAVAAGDIPLALEIGALSPMDWVQKGEYEDDFIYHLFLFLVLSGADAAKRKDTLERFERVLEGESSTRFAVCQALMTGAADTFAEAFRELCEQHAAEQLEERARFADVRTFEPRSRIFTEGFALMRIAESTGLRLPKHPYALCPEVGRVGPLHRRPDDLFAEMANIQ
ncbi:immunity 49 family protein [Archangium violaceum]|uniref:Uncharacterized protein n=1 Tax=Archangium violaceum Cb vi76 TaxID=1406225 RepID=A0A084T111_9BACT|nr:immunity 49 family protein [Archangium violaceum]KFA94396.1 hypothetical protein Q664_02955 [Archangium violaceum Cb vi76]